jgi:hypothetical protein
VFVPVRRLQSSLMFVGKLRTLEPTLESSTLKVLHSKVGSDLMSFRLSWKGLPGTNILVNYERSKIMDLQSFRTLIYRCSKTFYGRDLIMFLKSLDCLS